MTYKSERNMIMQTICEAINGMWNSRENYESIRSNKLSGYGLTHVYIGSAPNGRFNKQASDFKYAEKQRVVIENLKSVHHCDKEATVASCVDPSCVIDIIIYNVKEVDNDYINFDGNQSPEEYQSTRQLKFPLLQPDGMLSASRTKTQ